MNQRAFFAVVIGALIAGLSGLFIKQMSIPATSLAFIRTMLPSLLLGIWMWRQGLKFFRGRYDRMLLASTLNALRMYLFFVAYIYTSISNAVIMLFTWPIFVNVFSFFWLKERIGPRQLVLLVTAFSGIVLIYANQGFSTESNDFVGMTAALGAAFFYAISYIIYKAEIENYTRNEVIFYQNLVGGFVFLPFFLFVNPMPSLHDWGISIGYTIMMGIVIFNFFFYGLRFLKASQASSIAFLEIVSAIATGVIFFDDVITANMIVGTVLILGSISLLRKSD